MQVAQISHPSQTTLLQASQLQFKPSFPGARYRISATTMAQNISPSDAVSANPSKQNDSEVLAKDNHAVSKR